MNNIEQSNIESREGKRETANIERRTSNAEVALAWIKHFFDYLGASREEPPPGASFLASPFWLGIWWGVLIGLILLFCGQTSKFIYIDF